jgi:hypothetical protein
VYSFQLGFFYTNIANEYRNSRYALIPARIKWLELRLFEAPVMLERRSHIATLLAWVSNASGRCQWDHLSIPRLVWHYLDGNQLKYQCTEGVLRTFMKHVTHGTVVKYHYLTQIWLNSAQIFDISAVPESAMLSVVPLGKILLLLFEIIDDRIGVLLHRRCKDHQLVPFTYLS